MEPTPSTFHSIQVLRAVAALLVVTFHSHTALIEAGAHPVFSEETYLFQFGAVGVHIFFVISGFIMVVMSRFDPEFKPAEFLRRRLIRIYPIYWICAAIYLLYHALLGQPYSYSSEKLLGSLFLWPGDSAFIIGPAWTLSYEMFFYLCFALTMALGLNRGLIFLSTIFAILVLVGLVFEPKSSALHLATNSLLVEFVGGMAIGWLVKRNIAPRSRAGTWIAVAIGLYMAGAWYGFSRLPSAVVWGVPSVLLVLGAVGWELKHRAGSMTELIGGLGDSSYSLYLTHILLITVALDVGRDFFLMITNSAPALTAILSTICVVLAELFHRGVERPLLRRLKTRPILIARAAPGHSS
jgi:exopolysaccharide production protein ExoZ